jgi:glycine/D-amino acid oxidase-like deaminating enzyme
MLGLGLGPVTGKLVVQLVNGVEPELDLTPLRIERFSELARAPLPRPIVAARA